MQHKPVPITDGAKPIHLPVAEPVAASPAQLMMQAAQLNMSPETISQMMDLQARHMREEAQRAYVRDFAAFAAERPSVTKNKQVGFDGRNGGSRTQYRHETLDNLVDTIGPVLAKHGFSHAWQVHQEGARIKVTCTLRHRLGHSESVTMESGADTTGNKNPIQQVASAVTFLQRYTFRSVTGVATTDEHDDDGRASGDGVASGELPQFIQEWVDYCRDKRDDPAAFKRACAEARAEFNRTRDIAGLKQFNAAMGAAQ